MSASATRLSRQRLASHNGRHYTFVRLSAPGSLLEARAFLLGPRSHGSHVAAFSTAPALNIMHYVPLLALCLSDVLAGATNCAHPRPGRRLPVGPPPYRKGRPPLRARRPSAVRIMLAVLRRFDKLTAGRLRVLSIKRPSFTPPPDSCHYA